MAHAILPLLMTLHAAPMSNSPPRPDPPHKRMQLNNWLQAHGGTHRLAWNNYIAGGPSHRPNWCSDCFVDGSLLGQGHGPSKADAQEDAAGKTLANLLSSLETATHS